jgi:hypothetical protein
MESMVRLDSYDPRIRDYLLKHRYPVIMEVRKAADIISNYSDMTYMAQIEYVFRHS